MKFSRKVLMILLVAICAMSTVVYAGRNNFGGKSINQINKQSPVISATSGTLTGLIDQLPLEFLDEEEHLDLLHMYEEEKVARDVYSALFNMYGHWIFEHIAISEQKHMDAIAVLFQRYELALPDSAGTSQSFDSAEMQNLFTTLVEQGSLSLADALLVGARIEDLDIYDLQNYLELTDNEDIQTVYQNLLRGSRNHMRSFAYQLSLNDLEYTAQYLSQEKIDEIIATERERGLATNGRARKMGGTRTLQTIGVPQENCIQQ